MNDDLPNSTEDEQQLEVVLPGLIPQTVAPESLLVSFGHDEIRDHQKHEKSSETTEDEGTATKFVAIGLGIFLVIVIILSVIVVILRKRRRALRSTIENFLPKLAESKYTHKKATSFESEMRTLLLSNEAAIKFIMDNFGTSDQDQSVEKANSGLYVSIASCRFPNLKVFTPTEVQLSGYPKFSLHMNRIQDFNNRFIFLCQAPLQNEFHLLWQAVLQEKIGLIVVIGEFKEIVPYFPLKANSTETFSKITVKTVNVVEGELNVYEMQYWKTPLNQTTVKLFHIRNWSTDTPELAAKLAAIVQRSYEHVENEKQSPGLLLHCLNGLEESASLCASYLLYELWKTKKVVNIVEIIRHARQSRHRAFLVNQSKSVQLVQIVYQVMDCIIKTYH